MTVFDDDTKVLIEHKDIGGIGVGKPKSEWVLKFSFEPWGKGWIKGEIGYWWIAVAAVYGVYKLAQYSVGF